MELNLNARADAADARADTANARADVRADNRSPNTCSDRFDRLPCREPQR